LIVLLLAPAVLAEEPDTGALIEQAKQIFGPLPVEVANPANPVTQPKVDLGQKLYFDARLSKNQDISCNSCHPLDGFGADGEATSPGHMGQRGGRNSPTSFNAALHIAQFWDGREPDVERQALGPPLNPIEMAMADAAAVETVLRSIPAYGPMFEEAFPGEEQPVTYANMGRAIGAFERRLLTPGRFDEFMKGDREALTEPERKGLQLFISTGCITCHMGPAVGGGLYQKIGVVHAYETKDLGRYEVTKQESDRYVFKVPGLRNVAETGPYFHDGSVPTLEEAIRLMGYHQLGKELDRSTIDSIQSFLMSLTAPPDPTLTAQPMLPDSGPDTPAPDPS
jgi:cytochrome c peroxidase